MPRAPAPGSSRWLLSLAPLAAGSSFAANGLVQVEARGEESDVLALTASLDDWLKSLKLSVRRVDALPSGADDEVAARVRVVWLETACVVEVFRVDGEPVRKKELPRGGPALLVTESAALVAHAAVQELVLEEKRLVRVSTQPPVEPAVVEAAAPKSVVEVSVAAWFQSRTFDERSPVVFGGGGEVNVGLAVSAFRPGVSLVLAYQGPVARGGDFVTLSLQALSVRLLPGVRRRVGVFELEAGVGGGFDVLFADASSTTIQQYTKDRVDAAPFFSALLGARWHPTPSTGVMLRVLLDVDPARRRYVSSVAGEPTVLAVPWAVRPMVQLGFSFDLVRAE